MGSWPSTWLKASCSAKNIEDCTENSWNIRKENDDGNDDWLGVKDGLHVSYHTDGMFKYVIF